MGSASQRYEKLGLREGMSRMYDYPRACKELAFILRGAFTKLPKNLQAIIFQDTLTAFRLLPGVHTSRGVSAANLLVQAAEIALPKQKRALALTEFKHAIVANKRHSKAQKDEEVSLQLPQDVLVHIFSFLDMHSLVSVGLVCRSWNSAASDNILWQSQYDLFFGMSDLCCENEEQMGKMAQDQRNAILCRKEEDMDPLIHIDWKETFKRTYAGNPLWRSTSNRGYCGCCKSIIWLSNMKCSNCHHSSENEKQQQKIKPLSPHQVLEYLLGDSLLTASSSDSDSDSEQVTFGEKRLPKLWAYPRYSSGHLAH